MLVWKPKQPEGPQGPGSSLLTGDPVTSPLPPLLLSQSEFFWLAWAPGVGLDCWASPWGAPRPWGASAGRCLYL